MVDDEEFDDLTINLKNPNDFDINEIFKAKYPELYNVLFHVIDKKTLKLIFPQSYCLDIRSRTNKDQILKQFMNDHSDNSPEDVKPIELSNDNYPIEVYKWFAFLLGLNNLSTSTNTDCSSLTLGFNDTKGYVCHDGSESHEISITISERGIRWEWWPNKV